MHGIVRGTLEEAGTAFVDNEAVVLVPGEETLLTRVALPPIRQPKRRLAAARFALEDRLAGRIEALHFAPGTAASGQETPVAVVDATRMQAWCDAFETAGLDVVRVLPDALTLPAPGPEAWQLALFDDRVLVRTGPADAFACERDLWPMLAGALAPPATIHIHARSADAINALQGFDAIEPKPELTPHAHAGADALIGVLLDNGEAHRHPINLRQGDFARQSQFESRWRPFVLTGALAATWLVVAIAGRAIETWQLDNRIEALHQQTLAAFHGAFPDVQNINDLRVQAEQGIRSLRGAGGGGGLFAMLQATASVTGATDALQVQAMQYRNGELDLSINGDNVQSVETLRAGFAQQQDIQLSVQSADASASGVQIRASLTQGQNS
ncbi:type II secretion system protein GspL [Salinisphaera sp. Q1T1-3]|nr:type II secretion system protein GspL [Salinisphaera sp. Q1T1-3]